MVNVVKRYDQGAPSMPSLASVGMRQAALDLMRLLPQVTPGVRTGKLTSDAAQNGGVQVETGSPYFNIRLATGQRHSAGNAVVLALANNDVQAPYGIAVGGFMAP